MSIGSWRSACLLAGAPVGALVALAFTDHQTPAAVPIAGACLGSAALCAITAVLARRADPARLAAAAATGHAAWPAIGASALALPPGAPALALGVGAALAIALWRAARASASEARARSAGRSALRALALGAAACTALAIGLAAAAGSGPTHAPGRAEAIYDADARVATQALPVCAGAPRFEVLLERGARPRLAPDGDALWFDAPDDTGARQVHRLRLADGALACWTCGEPGDNLRPDPGGAGLLFETTRHASWRAPSNTEIHWIDTRGDAPRQPSRRLTYAPGPDDHALFAPGAPVVVWSRRSAGYEVVSAPIQRAHGGMSLGDATALARGGVAWLVPAAWSADARALVLLRGNPFAPLRAEALDFATGAQRALSERAADGGVAFTADGGFAIVAETRARWSGLWPGALAALVAPLAERAPGARWSGSALRAGALDGAALQPVALAELESWGAPTGVSLAPDGRSAVLGQRAPDGGERLVRVALGCE